MVKVKTLALLVAVALLFILPATVTAQAPPVHVFLVNKVNGAPPADGTVVAAVIGGAQVASKTAASGAAALNVSSLPGEPTYDGKSVSFTINGVAAAESKTFVSGGLDIVELTTAPVPTAAPPPVAQPTATPVPVSLVGPSGKAGPPGGKGDAGDKGSKGDKGDIGLVGPPGAAASVKGGKGDPGDAGPAGGAGPAGAAGPPGAAGPEGDGGSSVIGIIAIIVAAIAIVTAGAAFLLRRRGS